MGLLANARRSLIGIGEMLARCDTVRAAYCTAGHVCHASRLPLHGRSPKDCASATPTVTGICALAWQRCVGAHRSLAGVARGTRVWYPCAVFYKQLLWRDSAREAMQK